MTGVLLAIAAVGFGVFWRLTRAVRTGLPGCPWNPRRAMRVAVAAVVAAVVVILAIPCEAWLTLPVAFALFVSGVAHISFTLIDLLVFPGGTDRQSFAAQARGSSLSAHRRAELESTGAGRAR